MFGRPEAEGKRNAEGQSEEYFDNGKEALSAAERNPLAMRKEPFDDEKGILLKRIEDLERRVRDMDERMRQSENMIERLLSEKLTAPSQSAEAAAKEQETGLTLYLSAPTPDGVFADFDDKEHAGKSIYTLKSDNGQTGTFAVLNTVDAVSTALISLSQFIKPACKIESATSGVPSKILTVVEGEAAFNGEAWTVRRKAVIRLEK